MRTIVVGAGLAGCVIARELCRAGRHVTLLEAGEQTFAVPYQDGEHFTGQGPNLLFTRGSGYGGTTNYWHNGLIQLSPIDFLPKTDLHDWPIPFDELAQYYPDAERLLTNFSPPLLKGQRPYADSLPLSSERRGDFHMNSIRYPRSPINTKSLVPTQPNIEAEFNCKNLQLLFDRHTVKGLEYYQLGVKKRKFCDILILACGGLGTPILLLDSRNRGGIANSNIGHYLQDHICSTPLRIRFKSFQSTRRFFEEVPGGLIRYGVTYYDRINELHHIAYPRLAISTRIPIHTQELKRKLIAIRRSFLGIHDLYALLKNADVLFEAATHRFNLSFPTKVVSFNIVSEQKNLWRRRIDCGSDGPRIFWDVNNEERASIITFCKLLSARFADGIEEVCIASSENIQFTAGAHHSGTMRMARNSSSGVVDSNLKIFDLENVFVCDGSVLPRTGYANTGLTIAGLGIRLAKHIDSLAA